MSLAATAPRHALPMSAWNADVCMYQRKARHAARRLNSNSRVSVEPVHRRSDSRHNIQIYNCGIKICQRQAMYTKHISQTSA